MTNQEKISSSVVQQIMRELREDEELRAVLGDAIRMQGEWWLNGDPRIIGSVCAIVTLSARRTHSGLFRLAPCKEISTLALESKGPKVRIQPIFRVITAEYISLKVLAQSILPVSAVKRVFRSKPVRV